MFARVRWVGLVVVALVLATGAVLVASPVVVPGTMNTAGPAGTLNAFGAGQPAKAAEVNHNFKLLADASNDHEIQIAALKARLDALEAQIKLQGGNVGIGTAQPASKLTVAGLIETSEGLKFADGSVMTSGGLIPATPAGMRFIGKNGQGYHEFENIQDGSVMVYLPGGMFTMGSAANVGNADERPAHQVALAPVLVGKYEVTWKQWDAYVAAKPGSYVPSKAFTVTDNDPVHNVSWDDVQSYLTWAGVRLLTEAEWEYASRGGRTGNVYATSTGAISQDLANYTGKTGLDQYDNTSPVATFAANAYGLFDMSGNVWEWCNDWYDGGYYQTGASGATNPPGPGSGQYHVFRGGSWYHDPSLLRSAQRPYITPSSGNLFIGFRVARAP